MKYKIFIDGLSGTTGLNIFERLENRDDILILKIDENKRRDREYRRKLLNESDITFLCLPDDEAKVSVSLLDKDNKRTVIIDTSTAHRVSEQFVYGFPEMEKGNREKINKSQFISNPGCHSTGFIAILSPLVKGGIIKKDCNVFCHSITGYSGGGKTLINEYENQNRNLVYKAPRQYALSLEHKHLNEMKIHTGLKNKPIFNPIIGDFYSGMAVSVPLFKDYFLGEFTKKEVYEYLKEFYQNEKLINVHLDFDDEYINPTILAGKDILDIYVYGNDNQIEIVSIFDNLGKGACGSAIMNMNIVMGIEENTGLVL